MKHHIRCISLTQACRYINKLITYDIWLDEHTCYRYPIKSYVRSTYPSLKTLKFFAKIAQTMKLMVQIGTNIVQSSAPSFFYKTVKAMVSWTRSADLAINTQPWRFYFRADVIHVHRVGVKCMCIS